MTQEAGDLFDTEMSLPEPTPSTRPRSRALIMGVVGLVVGVAASTAVYVLLSQSSKTDAVSSAGSLTSVSSSPPASPSSSPSPHAPKPPAVVSSAFNETGPFETSWTQGSRLAFADFFVGYPENDCAVHTYTYKGKTHGAFKSDCASWESSGYDILLFYVGFKNRSHEVVTLNLRNFVLSARDGRTFGAVNVRSQADFPTSFLPETQKLPPKATWYGWVTFDGRVVGLAPASISYIDGKQTLTQTFEGGHHVVPAS